MAMNMRWHKFLVVVSSTLLLTVSQSFWLNFPSMFGEAVVAQIPDARKQVADRLFQQGIKQLQTSPRKRLSTTSSR
ncbi:MAG: hypothetical protein PUP92_35555 [Rhizonema sp. PD38]|nr:hypothetical protein [Rhizonema sp. PD38]